MANVNANINNTNDTFNLYGLKRHTPGHTFQADFEARVFAKIKKKKGPLSIDLEHDLEQNPVAGQMRRSLLDYMAGNRFQPKQDVAPDQLQQLLAAPSAMVSAVTTSMTACITVIRESSSTTAGIG